MKNLLVGLAIGLPLGMLLGDTLLRREGRWQERAREWMQASCGGLEDAGQRIREVVEQNLRKLPGNAGQNVADLVNRQAEATRNAASAQHAAINHVAREELLGVYGIGPVLANRILAGRPYGSDYDVVTRGIISETVFRQLQRQVLNQHKQSA